MGCLQLVEGVHMPVATDTAINQSLSLKEEAITNRNDCLVEIRGSRVHSPSKLFVGHIIFCSQYLVLVVQK